PLSRRATAARPRLRSTRPRSLRRRAAVSDQVPPLRGTTPQGGALMASSITPKNASTPTYGGTAGDVYTPEQAVEVAATIAAEESSLAALVSRNHADAFMAPGKGGAPIFIKQPTTLVARTRKIDDTSSQLVMDKIA